MAQKRKPAYQRRGDPPKCRDGRAHRRHCRAAPETAVVSRREQTHRKAERENIERAHAGCSRKRRNGDISETFRESVFKLDRQSTRLVHFKADMVWAQNSCVV